MLKDNGFIGGMRALIAGGENPPSAVLRIFTKYRDIFLKSPSQIIREKAQDIEDLTERIIANLAPVRADSESHSGSIIIARDLFPSGLLKLSAEGIAGAVLVSGGVTSHVSILARSLELPLVFIDEPRLLALPQGTEALLDADVGNLYVNPSAEVVSRFRERDRAVEELGIDHELLAKPTATADGAPVTLSININLLSDILRSRDVNIDGVGLYRTEFPFMIRSTFPTEEEQYVIYKKLIDDMKGKPVTFRTLDIGGDKVLPTMKARKRKIRFSACARSGSPFATPTSSGSRYARSCAPGARAA
jgi:phosphotransferase system enzyme I (PtsP)